MDGPTPDPTHEPLIMGTSPEMTVSYHYKHVCLSTDDVPGRVAFFFTPAEANQIGAALIYAAAHPPPTTLVRGADTRPQVV